MSTQKTVRQQAGTVEENSLRMDTEKAEQVIDALNTDLADTYVAYPPIKKHHWNVEGAEFRDLHLFLGEAAENAEAAADEIAERLQALGGTPVSNPVNQAEMATVVEKIPLSTLAKLFRGFGDASRLAILEVLRSGSRNVSEIVETTGLTQPNVSNHLSCLADCGLVRREQRGRYAYYGLSDPRVARLLEAADELIADVAVGVDACRRYEVEAP